MGTIALAQRTKSAAALSDSAAAQPGPVFSRRNIILCVVLVIVAFTSLLAYQYRFGIPITGVTLAPHFIYQAESLLHGHWDVQMRPGYTDTAYVHGKVYILYPPFPAFLMLPFVAIFGMATSDVLFTTVISAFNLPLLYLLFEQLRASGLSRRKWLDNLIISVLFYYGSINLWLSLGGCMWFTGQIVGMSCTLLSLLLAFRRHYAWSAVLLGCAFFTRATLALGFPLLLYLAWQEGGAQRVLEPFLRSVLKRTPAWETVPWRRLAPVAAVIVVSAMLFLAHNLAIYGSPLETGYNIVVHQQYPAARYGTFSLRYVPANVIADFFSFPRIVFAGPQDMHPALDMLNGGVAVSVFVTTPLFLGLIFWRNQQFSPLRAALWGTLGLQVAATLLFHEAGWYQFGARYLYDGYPYAFLLLVLNEVRLDWRFAVLGVIGIVINQLGAHQFWTSAILHL